MIEFAFELEHGALRAAPAPPRRVPLYERNPLRFWQVVALLLALVLAAGPCEPGADRGQPSLRRASARQCPAGRRRRLGLSGRATVM
jgi:hypothetical protein